MTNYQVVPQSTEIKEAEVVSGLAEASNAPCKVYRRRWVMLFLFVLVSMSNAFQWIHFSIITDVIMVYYGVSSQAVDWTSMVYMITYIPLIFPGAWLLNKKGLRVTILLGAFGTALGAWIKVLSVSPDRFYVAFIGQTVVAIAQVFILGIPSQVAAVWFGPDQVSSACAVGVFGNQLGVAIGFLLPPELVKMNEDINVIGSGLSLMFYSVAGVCTVLFLLVIFVFQASPPTPPSAARAPVESEPPHYTKSMLKLVRNRNYVLLTISYGINTGVFYAISTLLNQVVLSYFPGEGENAGRIGLTIVFCGMLGSIVCGVILDRTHKFKETTLVIYVLSFVGMIAYTFTFQVRHIAVTFIMAAILGFFMTGYLPVGFEFAAELTYPEPEGTTSGLLNASAQIFGILFILAGGWLLSDYGDLVCNIVLAASLLIGSVITALIGSDLRRQAAAQKAQVQNPTNP